MDREKQCSVFKKIYDNSNLAKGNQKQKLCCLLKRIFTLSMLS